MMNRTAENLFWIGRYLERAENHTRLIDVNFHTRHVLIDNGEKCKWERLIATIGSHELFSEQFDHANEATALQFLTFEQTNPNSLFSCVCFMRNNVRALRQMLPSELWDIMNGFYLWLKEQDISQLMMQSPYMFYQRLREWISLINGTADTTMDRDLVWNFIQAGKFFERAENILRILHSYLHCTKDMLSHSSHDNYARLSALLKSAGAFEAYRKHYADDVTLAKVIEFLISDATFPHSVKYSLSALENDLAAIKQQDYQFDLLAEIAIGVVAKMKSILADLHGENDYLIGLQLIQDMLESINRLGVEISETFFQEEFVKV